MQFLTIGTLYCEHVKFSKGTYLQLIRVTFFKKILLLLLSSSLFAIGSEIYTYKNLCLSVFSVEKMVKFKEEERIPLPCMRFSYFRLVFTVKEDSR